LPSKLKVTSRTEFYPKETEKIPDF